MHYTAPRQAGGLDHADGGHPADRSPRAKGLASAASLSPRFLADVEAGRANISVVRLSSLAEALGLPITALRRPPGGGAADGGHDDAMADLRSLIERREARYRQADRAVDTSGISSDEVAAAIISALEAAGRRP